MDKAVVRKQLSRVLISLLGAAFIFWGVSLFALGLVGTKDTAVITSVRRQGGERREANPNRYTYIISYTFKLPDGRSMDGFTTRIGNAVYVKNPNSLTSVRYLSFFPLIHALEKDTELGFRQVLYIALGSGLLYIMNRTPQKARYRVKKRIASK